MDSKLACIYIQVDSEVDTVEPTWWWMENIVVWCRQSILWTCKHVEADTTQSSLIHTKSWLVSIYIIRLEIVRLLDTDTQDVKTILIINVALHTQCARLSPGNFLPTSVWFQNHILTTCESDSYKQRSKHISHHILANTLDWHNQPAPTLQCWIQRVGRSKAPLTLRMMVSGKENWVLAISQDALCYQRCQSIVQHHVLYLNLEHQTLAPVVLYILHKEMVVELSRVLYTTNPNRAPVPGLGGTERVEREPHRAVTENEASRLCY